MNGMEMMLKSFGIDPKDIQEKIQTFATQANEHLKKTSEKIEEIQKTQKELKDMIFISFKTVETQLLLLEQKLTQRTGEIHDAGTGAAQTSAVSEFDRQNV